MKATLYVNFDEPNTPLVISKLQQWTEFLQAAGVDATFIVQPDDPPAADLWQALNGDEVKADEQS